MARLPGVRAVVANLGFQGVVVKQPDPTGPSTYLNVVVNSTDLDKAQALVPVKLVSGRLFTPGAAEVVVSSRSAANLFLHVGDQFRLLNPELFQTVPRGPGPSGPPSGAARAGPNGPLSAPAAIPNDRLPVVTVVGITEYRSVGVTNQQDVVFTSIQFADSVRTKHGQLSALSIALDPKVDVALWIAQHSDSLGSDVTAAAPAPFATGTRKFLDVIQASLGGVAAMALFLGGFLIFLTLAIAVDERTHLYGTLRAVGASAGQVRRVVLTEAALLGGVSSIVGLGLGYLLSFGIISYTTRTAGLRSTSPVFSPRALLVSLLLGIVVTVVAAYVPARRAGRLDPVESMRRVDAGTRRRPIVPALGLAMVVLGGALPVIVPRRGPRSIALVLLLGGAVFLVGPVVAPMAQVVGRLTSRLQPSVGWVAVKHLVKARSRSASTLGLVMVVLALVMAVATIYASDKALGDHVLKSQYGADLQAYVAQVIDVPPLASGALDGVVGVRHFTTLQRGQVRLRGTGSVKGIVIEPDRYFAFESFSWIDGNDARAQVALARGGSVLLPSTVAFAANARQGGTVQLSGDGGAYRPYRVAGIFSAFGDGPRAAIVFGPPDSALLTSLTATLVDVELAPGAPPKVVEDAVRQRLGTGRTFVQSGADIKRFSQRQLQQVFSIFFALLIVGPIVGLLGLATTLTASVVERYREIGVLRAVGAQARQVGAIVVVEAATLATVAIVLSLPLGIALSLVLVGGSGDSTGTPAPFAFPWAVLPILALLAMVVAAGAAYLPAKRATRVDVIEVLRFE